MTISLKEFVSRAKSRVIQEDHGYDHKKDPPVLLTMRRKTVRNFPDGQKVALYYITSLDRYLSIPFDNKGTTQGLPALSQEESEVEEMTNPVMSSAGDEVPEKDTNDKNPDKDGELEEQYGQHIKDGHTIVTHDGRHIGSVSQSGHKYIATHDHARDEDGAPTTTHKDHDEAVRHIKNWHNGVEKDINSLREESLEEATKPAKKKPKVKPYDFMKHLKDIATGGEDKNKPLRFTSGERHRLSPEDAMIVMDVHKKLNLSNQATASKMMRTSKDGFHRVKGFAMGMAVVPK